MESVSVDKENKVLEVTFGGQRLGYPIVWLRDNCQCSECFHPVSRARTFLLRNLDPNIIPLTTELQDDSLLITWPDQHQSTYSSQWLRHHAFNDERRDEEDRSLHRDERLWTSREMSDNIPRISFKKLMEDDSAVLEWLLHLEQDGICLIVEAPACKGVFSQISDRIAYPKRTFYGYWLLKGSFLFSETFLVERKKNPNNVAYTSASLGLHTDQPQLNYTPGVQLLHCITQAGEGGENIFADGFKVAEDLRRNHPEMFDTLCNTPVNFQDEGVEGGLPFRMKTKPYTIECDKSGTVTKVNYNNQIRDSVMTVTIEAVKAFYKALTQYESMLMDPKYSIRYKMKSGEIACFHNYRVMHGREAYRMAADEERLLEGWYMDWDELLSKRRVLEKKLASC